MKKHLYLPACATTLLLVPGCCLLGPPAAPAAWNSEWCTYEAVHPKQLATMKQGFGTCVAVEYFVPDITRHTQGKKVPGRAAWRLEQGDELNAILTRLREIPHWYEPHYKRGLDIGLIPQDLESLRFLDAEGQVIYEEHRRCAPYCVGPDGHS